MKRFYSILVISMALLLPMTAKAASAGVKFECDNKTCVDNGDTCQRTCSIYVTSDEAYSLNTFSGTISMTDSRVTIAEITPASGWTNLGGTSANLSLATTDGENKTGTKIDIATIKINIPKGDDVNCELGLQTQNLGKATIKVEVEQEIVKTGVTLPLAIIACGVAAAGVVYFVSNKNKKMYKI